MKRVFESFLVVGLALSVVAPASAEDKKDGGSKDGKPAAKAPQKDGQGAAKTEKGGKGAAKGDKARKEFNPADGLLKKLAAANWTEEQSAKARELGASFAKTFRASMEKARPTKEQQTAMKQAAAQAKKDGKDKKAAYEAINAAAQFTDEQKAAREECNKLRGEFMASVMDLLSDEQKAGLKKAQSDAKKKSGQKGQGGGAKGDKQKSAPQKSKDGGQKPAEKKSKDA